jgi:hypothetical protein
MLGRQRLDSFRLLIGTSKLLRGAQAFAGIKAAFAALVDFFFSAYAGWR